MSELKVMPGRRQGKIIDRRRMFAQAAALTGIGVGGLLAMRWSIGAPADGDNSAAGAKSADEKSTARGTTSSISGEIKEYKDEATGARVKRLTGDGSDNVHPYFTSATFVGEAAERLVLTSNRSGRFQHYLLDIPAGKLVQLTDGQKVSPNNLCVAPDGRVFYLDGPELRVVSVDTLEDRKLYRVPSDTQPHLPTCTADGKYVAFAYSQRREVSTETGKIYSTMAETYFQHPSCVVMRIDAATGEAVAAWGELNWISHVLIHPTEPNIILFCHEGGSNVAQRMWTVDLNERLARRARPLYPQKPGEFCVHEYFTREGDVGFQYSIERAGQREEFNAFIRPDGSWIRQFRLPGQRPGHIQSNSDNSVLIGDRGHVSADDKDGGAYMALITHRGGGEEVRRLCKHGTSWKTQWSHPHAVFSRDDRWVVYNSDAGGGKCNVYMAEVGSLG